MKQATLGAGCFWGVEEVLQNVEGINATRVGYMGGDFENPTYEDVCSDQTGHVEVVEIEYDPAVVSYENLLSLFWRMHDPTSLNKQSAYEKGSQYGAVIFFTIRIRKLWQSHQKRHLKTAGSIKLRLSQKLSWCRSFGLLKNIIRNTYRKVAHITVVFSIEVLPKGKR